MRQRTIFHFLIFCFLIGFWAMGRSYGQLLPPEQIYEWPLAGFREIPPSFSITQNILDFGGDNTGATQNNTALQNAIDGLDGNSGIIYFPPGEYLFSQGVTLPDSIILRGASREETILRFDFGGISPSNEIYVGGSPTNTISKLTSSSVRGLEYAVVESASFFNVNDYVTLYQTDTAYVLSSWAWYSSGQICKVKNISGDTLFFDSKLRRNFTVSDSSKVRKVLLKSFVGIECLKIINHTQTNEQTSIIQFNYTSNCWVSGIESDSCHFAHVSISHSTNVVVKNSFFHRAFSYGGGGEGYGISLEYTSGECLIQNNIFSTLRHAVLLQSGANGNVIGYNYVTDPRYLGDIVLHGNYPYANLFEGNTIPTISIDNSHNINGPHNFFYRNRATGLGISMSSALPSDSQAFVANEMANLLYGLLSVYGQGQITLWNNKNNDLTETPPEGLLSASYYVNHKPDFFSGNDTWPPIGPPAPFNVEKIPAEKNYSAGQYANCGTIVTNTQKTFSASPIRLYPNPGAEEIFLTGIPSSTKRITLFNNQGKRLIEYSPTPLLLLPTTLPPGIYQLCIDSEKNREWIQFIKAE